MKKYILLLIMSVSLVNLGYSQNNLESNPTLLGVVIGDDFSQWENKLKYEGSKDNFNKFNYVFSGEKTLASTQLQKINFIFNKDNKNLEALLITTKKFKEGMFDPKQFEPILKYLKQEFGDPDSTTEDGDNLLFSWQSKSYILTMTYVWGGNSLSEYTNEVTVYLSSRRIINTSERL